MSARLRGLSLLTLLVVAPLALAQSSQQVWVSDIQAQPARFWNTTVTVVGQVMDVAANPAGTTRGTYELLDESSTMPLRVRTRDLPPVGREYAVTGTIIQDPARAGVALLDELERAEPSNTNWLRMALIGGAVLLGVLLIVLVALMLRSQPSAPAPVAAPAPPTFTPAPPTEQPADFRTRREPAAGATRKLDAGAAMAAAGDAGDRTRVFASLGYEIAVEKGPDKGGVHRLHKPVTTIGRKGGRNNDIVVSDDTVSKEQASLTFDATTGKFTLTNQSVTNPTRVNGRMATEPMVLEADAAIEMGSTVLRFRKE